MTPTASAAPELPAIITVKNNPELAALLKLADNCSNKVDRFAKKYADQTIEFDGSIQAMAPHGTHKTRFDILVGPGGFDPNKGIGPTFQFNDKSVVYDLHLTGKHIPDYVKGWPELHLHRTAGRVRLGLLLVPADTGRDEGSVARDRGPQRIRSSPLRPRCPPCSDHKGASADPDLCPGDASWLRWSSLPGDRIRTPMRTCDPAPSCLPAEPGQSTLSAPEN